MERCQAILCTPYGTKVPCQVDGFRSLLDISTGTQLTDAKTHYRRHYVAGAVVQKLQSDGFKITDHLPGFVGLTKSHLIDTPAENEKEVRSQQDGEVSFAHVHTYGA